MTTTTTEPGRVIWRYATLGGATVVVTRHDDEAHVTTDYSNQKRKIVEDCRWQCLGCGDSDVWNGDYYPVMTETKAQEQANHHAGECRSLPVVAQTVEPSPAAELAAMRVEIHKVTEAVQALAATVDKAVDPLAYISCMLPDITSAISDMAGPGEGLADIATAVESLVASHDRPRRSWLGRRRSARETTEPEVNR